MRRFWCPGSRIVRVKRGYLLIFLWDMVEICLRLHVVGYVYHTLAIAWLRFYGAEIG